MKRNHLFAALVLASGLLAAACSSDSPPTAPSPAPAFKKAAASPTLVVCSTKKHGSVSQQVDWQGATLQVNGHTLVIPPHALSSPVTITMSQAKGMNTQVDLQPQGLQFAVPAILTLNYSSCKVPPSSAYVVYLNPDSTLEPLASVDNSQVHQVTAPLAHFSGYAVAW